MIENNGYVLVYKPKENQIVITLPQTVSTLTSTVSPVADRRIDICTEEEAVILNVVKAIMEKPHDHFCGTCRHYLGGGDFGTCCDQTYSLKYRHTKACEKYDESR